MKAPHADGTRFNLHVREVDTRILAAGIDGKWKKARTIVTDAHGVRHLHVGSARCTGMEEVEVRGDDVTYGRRWEGPASLKVGADLKVTANGSVRWPDGTVGCILRLR